MNFQLSNLTNLTFFSFFLSMMWRMRLPIVAYQKDCNLGYFYCHRQFFHTFVIEVIEFIGHCRYTRSCPLYSYKKRNIRMKQQREGHACSNYDMYNTQTKISAFCYQRYHDYWNTFANMHLGQRTYHNISICNMI